MSDVDNELRYEEINKSNISDLRRYHKQQLKKEAENTPPEEEPIYVKGTPAIRGGAVIGIGVVVIVFSAMIMPPESAVVWGMMVSFVSAFAITQWGVVTRRVLSDHKQDTGSQQQQQSSSSKPKQICSNCGWRNPQTNNYCHDCGAELDTE